MADKPANIGLRPTTEELVILEQWCKDHPDTWGNPATMTDALRAAIVALWRLEGKRKRDAKRRADRKKDSDRINWIMRKTAY